MTDTSTIPKPIRIPVVPISNVLDPSTWFYQCTKCGLPSPTLDGYYMHYATVHIVMPEYTSNLPTNPLPNPSPNPSPNPQTTDPAETTEEKSFFNKYKLAIAGLALMLVLASILMLIFGRK